MNDLRDLYAEVVMDHNRRPRNLKKIEGADRKAEGFNPLCGDQISLFVDLGEGGSIEDIGYTAAGCAISKAAASMMRRGGQGPEFTRRAKSCHGVQTAPDQRCPQ